MSLFDSVCGGMWLSNLKTMCEGEGGGSLSRVMTLACHTEAMCCKLAYWSEGETVRVSLDSGLCVHLKVCICSLGPPPPPRGAAVYRCERKRCT